MTPPPKSFHIDVVDVGTVTATNDQTLLTSLEQAGVQAQFHCREGFCGACRATLLSGDVDYTTDPLAFIDDDEILPCCCIPLSPLTVKVPL